METGSSLKVEICACVCENATYVCVSYIYTYESIFINVIHVTNIYSICMINVSILHNIQYIMYNSIICIYNVYIII